MKDVQSQKDSRGIAINQVGVEGLVYPITLLLGKDKIPQSTVGTWRLAVNLPHDVRGTHMSRFVEVLNMHHQNICTDTMALILNDLTSRLESSNAVAEVEFSYFIQRGAPESGAYAWLDIKSWFKGEIKNGVMTMTRGISAPVTSLCPCSKEISDYGAHNQRSMLTIELQGQKPDLDELIDIAGHSASAPVYTLLKRSDERHVTMQAFENPVFVEDMVRNAAKSLMEIEELEWFKVYARNQESIHNHDAFAEIEWTRP